jgi:hypothetical protein
MEMRYPKLLATLGACAVLCTAIFGQSAMADDEFDVNVNGGQIVVVSKGGWHINKNYPWKLTVGDTKVDKSKFSFTETSATLAGAPKGQAHLKGGVCSGDKCKNFEKVVSVQ